MQQKMMNCLTVEARVQENLLDSLLVTIQVNNNVIFLAGICCRDEKKEASA